MGKWGWRVDASRWSLQLLLLLASSLTLATDLPGLKCLCDFNTTISCDWNSSAQSPPITAATSCKLKTEKMRPGGGSTRYKSECDMRPRDPAHPALRACSLVLPPNLSQGFRYSDKWKMILDCESMNTTTIIYRPADYTKLKRPSTPEVNLTAVSLFSEVPRLEWIDERDIQLQWIKVGQPWGAQNITMETRCDPLCQMELTGLEKGEQYQARSRVRPSQDLYKSEWSDWSPVLQWVSAVGTEVSSTTDHSILSQCLCWKEKCRKDEATRNKEQRMFTDLHTTLVGEGLIAARPLDSGPPRGGDQGNGGGPLGVYGRMYPTLPSCGPDGEYIFPMQPSSPSGGLQESRHSVLSDVNSFIGEYPVICSTPHVPRKGNPSAPPDYANHDAIQIPQQFLHPNPPIQQPPEVRPGTVTKNESRIGGFDDNKQPHCSAMGGAATPHMTTKDEKDEIVNLRPLKKIESAEGRTILYEPSSPKDIEKWSTEIDHPRRAGLQPWMKLKQLMLLYELHPYDGFAILFKHLSGTERTQIRYDVEDAIGEDGMRPEKGWEAIKAWIQKHSKAQVNWTTITRCMQKEDEGLDQFNKRFFECYLLYSGQTEYDMDNIDQSQDLPLKTMYLQQVLPEIRRGVKTRFPGWDNQSSTMAEIKEFGEKVDRDEEVRIRFLADEKKEIARERERFPQSNRDSGRFPQPVRQKEPRPCHNCGQIGHWIRECKAPRKMYRDRSNERVGEENRSDKMRELLKKLQA